MRPATMIGRGRAGRWSYVRKRGSCCARRWVMRGRYSRVEHCEVRCVSTRRMAGCVAADPLVVFRDIVVGWSGWALWTCADTSMALLVVDNAKRRVALNDPDILP